MLCAVMIWKSDAEKAEYVKSAYPPLLFAEFYKQGTEDHLGYRADDESLVILRGKLDLAKSQASQSDSVNAEVARIMDILKQTDMNFSEFDDVTVRRLVECIQVCGNKKIIVTLKGGYQAEEELRRIEAA